MAGQPASQTLTLRCAMDKAIEIVGLEHDLGDSVDFKLAEVEKGRVYSLTAAANARAAIRHTGRVALSLAGGPVERFFLDVFLVVQAAGAAKK